MLPPQKIEQLQTLTILGLYQVPYSDYQVLCQATPSRSLGATGRPAPAASLCCKKRDLCWENPSNNY